MVSLSLFGIALIFPCLFSSYHGVYNVHVYASIIAKLKTDIAEMILLLPSFHKFVFVLIVFSAPKYSILFIIIIITKNKLKF